MGDWIKDHVERKRLADKLHSEHRRETAKTQANDAEMELAKIDDAWKAACDQGEETGSVSLCWLDMQHVGERVYSFERDYRSKLMKLRLDGIGLTTADVEGIAKHCLHLEKLSLAANCIEDISSCSIQNLSRLTELNLLRNQLTRLPASICLLNNLTRLDVANNKLTELPPEISNLRGLKQLILEGNELRELPSTFGKLECEVLNLNSNKFIVCPSCIIDMKQLRQLSINGNEIGCLPCGLQKLKKLEVIHASKNRLTVLPDSIVDVYSLRCLWFDFNKLSAIPPNFHQLKRLKELKLEGNADLVYPPIRIVAKGTEEVLRWSRNRLEMAKSAKIRHIVQSLEEVMNLVQRYKIGGSIHESLFEVVDDNQFQFPPDALWNIFLPELRKMSNTHRDAVSFPYERTEVEQAIFQFRDAAGPIVKKTARAMFRRCSCMETGQSTLVCIPPKTGWMCTRPALLLRKECYEENMREKRRQMAEEKRVADAERAAKNLATAFLASEEGILTVREEALKRMALFSREDLTHNSSMRKIFKKVSSSINSRHSETKAMLKQIEEKIRDEYLREKINESREDVLDRNKRIEWIMRSWMGLSLFDAFEGWRYSVELANSQRRREQRNELKEERLRYEDELAQYEYDKIDVSHWNKSWDEWNDVPIWIHAITNETQYDKPVAPPQPQVPKSLVDPSTGLMLSRQEIQQIEADTDSSYSSDSGSLSSIGGNERNKENTNESAKLKIDDAPKGMNSEVELAKRRVLEIQRNHVLTKYKI